MDEDWLIQWQRNYMAGGQMQPPTQMSGQQTSAFPQEMSPLMFGGMNGFNGLNGKNAVGSDAMGGMSGLGVMNGMGLQNGIMAGMNSGIMGMGGFMGIGGMMGMGAMNSGIGGMTSAFGPAMFSQMQQPSNVVGKAEAVSTAKPVPATKPQEDEDVCLFVTDKNDHKEPTNVVCLGSSKGDGKTGPTKSVDLLKKTKTLRAKRQAAAAAAAGVYLESDPEEDCQEFNPQLRKGELCQKLSEAEKKIMQLEKELEELDSTSDNGFEDDGEASDIIIIISSEDEEEETIEKLPDVNDEVWDVPEDFAYLNDDDDFKVPKLSIKNLPKPKSPPKFSSEGPVCKACQVRPALFLIIACNHYGLCSKCKNRYSTGEAKKCPGCQVFHPVFCRRVWC